MLVQNIVISSDVSVGIADILHNTSYSYKMHLHCDSKPLKSAVCYYNLYYVNIAWGSFWCERWQQLFAFLLYHLKTIVD